MDKKDTWLLELYEGSGAPPNAESDSAEEAVSLREMKDWLDARSAIRSARPDPEAVEAVLAAAQQASPSGARKDRPARRRTPARRRALRRMAGGVLVAALATIALVGLFRLDVLAPASTDTAALDASAEGVVSETVSEASPPTGEGEAGGESAESGESVADMPRGEAASVASSPETAPPPAALADAASVADETLQSASAANEQADSGAPAVPADIPAWDDPSDVMYLQQRIQRIGEGVADGWDAPVAPLEMLPAGSGGGGLIPASERR